MDIQKASPARKIRFLAIFLVLFTVTIPAFRQPSTATGREYAVTKMAGRTYPIGPRGPGALNNDGQAAYTFQPDGTVADLYVYRNNLHTLLYSANETDSLFYSFNNTTVSINDHGITAFMAQPYSVIGGHGIFKGDGAAPVTIALDNYEDPCSFIYQFQGSTDINDSGDVVFWAKRTVTYDQMIVKGNGSGLTIIADTASTTTDQGKEFFEIGLSPIVDAEGNVAFWGRLEPQASNVWGIFLGDGTTVRHLYDSTGPFNWFYQGYDINDSGTVAFSASLDTGVNGIFTGNGGAYQTVVDNRGPFLSFEDLAINNLGEMAFEAKLDSTRTANGIYVGPDPVADKVISEGDALLGGTVKSLYFFRGFNDRGQIVCRIIIENGAGQWDDGIYLISPVTAACGDESHPYPPGDRTEDCRVNLFDYAFLAAEWIDLYSLADLLELTNNWLSCTHPTDCP